MPAEHGSWLCCCPGELAAATTPPRCEQCRHPGSRFAAQSTAVGSRRRGMAPLATRALKRQCCSRPVGRPSQRPACVSMQRTCMPEPSDGSVTSTCRSALSSWPSCAHASVRLSWYTAVPLSSCSRQHTAAGRYRAGDGHRAAQLASQKGHSSTQARRRSAREPASNRPPPQQWARRTAPTAPRAPVRRPPPSSLECAWP